METAWSEEKAATDKGIRIHCNHGKASTGEMMSKISCICGDTIRDNCDSLPYKARILKDTAYGPFFDWLVSEVQSYVVAAQLGETSDWLVSRGYSSDYIGLQLDHGNVLHDHLHTRLHCLERTAYECTACGRLLIETAEDNRFETYAPVSGRYGGILK
ncbi:hypothetical protein [Burkholderia sp. BCC0322]|uniref:hypothetical protein n=1 Tax=unclassified Burkholderia TaxID=2613784 RepID=UPI0015887852|nr:hypothetical protein [Burkholderia sp. BCC0322]